MLSGQTQISRQLRDLGHLFDLLVELSFFKQKLVQATDGIGLNVLGHGKTTKNNTTEHIAIFLQDMSSCLSDVLDTHNSADIASSQVLLIVLDVKSQF